MARVLHSNGRASVFSCPLIEYHQEYKKWSNRGTRIRETIKCLSQYGNRHRSLYTRSVFGSIRLVRQTAADATSYSTTAFLRTTYHMRRVCFVRATTVTCRRPDSWVPLPKSTEPNCMNRTDGITPKLRQPSTPHMRSKSRRRSLAK